MASKYSIRLRLEHNKTHTIDLIILDGEEFQPVTRKRKALENLTDSITNTIISQTTRSGKIGRSFTVAKLASKEVRQQKIQFLSPGHSAEVFESIEQDTETLMESTPVLIEETSAPTQSL